MKTIFTIFMTVGLTLSVWAQDKGFVHTVTADNLYNYDYVTALDHPDLNGNPDARFLFSQRYEGTSNNHPTGIWYNAGTWTIYNEDKEAFPLGTAFNIYIPDHSTTEVHIANSSNTTDYYTELSGYSELDFLFYNTYYNPHSVYNPYLYANQFWEGKRVLGVETLENIPNNAAFVVMKGVGTSATGGGVASTPSNTVNNHLIIDHAALNNNPNAVFIYSHYFNYLGNDTLLPAVTEAAYNASTGHWQIFNYGGDFPEGVWIDFFIPDLILGTNDIQTEISKIKLYPNPAVDYVNISSSNKEIKEVQMYDITGKQVQFFVQKGKEITLNISALPAGIYIAKIKTDEGWFSQKLIKK